MPALTEPAENILVLVESRCQFIGLDAVHEHIFMDRNNNRITFDLIKSVNTTRAPSGSRSPTRCITATGSAMASARSTISPVVNPCPLGLAWLFGIGVEPDPSLVLGTIKAIDAVIREYGLPAL